MQLFAPQTVTLLSGSATSRVSELFYRCAINLSHGRPPFFDGEGEIEFTKIPAGAVAIPHSVVIASLTDPAASILAQIQRIDPTFDPATVMNLHLHRDEKAPQLFETIARELEDRGYEEMIDAARAGDDRNPMSIFLVGLACAFGPTQNINRYSDVAALMKNLKNFAVENNVRLFCLMPVGKNTAAYDPKERVLGATAWGEMADLVIDVQIPTNDHMPDPESTARQVWICPKGGYVSHVRATVKSKGRFELKAPAPKSRRGKSPAWAILDEELQRQYADLSSFTAAHAHGWLLTRGEECSKPTMLRWLSHAVEEGMIERKGTYHNPFYVPVPAYFMVN